VFAPTPRQRKRVPSSFIVIRNYTDAACATAPTAFTFYQTGVCFVQNATASSLVTATVSTATGVTSFRQTSYGGYKCNGPVSGGQVLGNTTQVCMKTPGSSPLTYYTVTAAPVMALTGGTTLAAFATPVDCAATNFGKVATGQLFLPAACGAVLSRNTTSTAMSSCGTTFRPLFWSFFASHRRVHRCQVCPRRKSRRSSTRPRPSPAPL
jgi:hypothetical protein